jgi:hypothetical protein
MMKQPQERRPTEEHTAGLKRFLQPSIKLRKRNNNQPRFGLVTIERGFDAICKHDRDDNQKHTA